jgi:hypothetical protein
LHQQAIATQLATSQPVLHIRNCSSRSAVGTQTNRGSSFQSQKAPSRRRDEKQMLERIINPYPPSKSPILTGYPFFGEKGGRIYLL